MKKINIRVSDQSEVTDIISTLRHQIPESTKNAPEFEVAFEHVAVCINDFCQKAKKFSVKGTKIHIEQEFVIAKTRIVVVLDYPIRKNTLGWLKAPLEKIRK